MIIVPGLPPNYDKILKAFHPSKGVIFCYGDKIYKNGNMKITPALIDHETIHSRQQRNDPEEWWDRYIKDMVFRLSQEIPAHRAEYHWCLNAGYGRADRRAQLRGIAKKLSSRLYGGLITFNEAKHLLVLENI